MHYQEQSNKVIEWQNQNMIPYENIIKFEVKKISSLRGCEILI
jgi:hypothetical protein